MLNRIILFDFLKFFNFLFNIKSTAKTASANLVMRAGTVIRMNNK